jgi:hypothetical protein
MPISARIVTRLSRGARACSFRGCSGDAIPRARPNRRSQRSGVEPLHVRRHVDRPIVDAADGHELRPIGQNGGTLSLVPEGPGLAVAYPERCALPRERDCPRAILEGERDDTLNPGTRPL